MRADLDTIADIWVDAFSDDPWLRYMQPDAAGWDHFARVWMRFVAERVFARGHTFVSDTGDAAVGWIPPDLAFLGADDMGHAYDIIAAASGTDRADSCLATMAMVRDQIDADPHWVLQWIGVRSHRRGSGMGAQLVAPGLASCDADGFSCWLVSSNIRNVAFYERQGFAVVAEVHSPDAAITLRPMKRAAR